MALPYTIDSLLAKQNLFYNECNELAQTIADEIINNDQHNDEDEDIEDYTLTAMREYVGETMTAYADDLINSYGIARAMRLYLADCEEQGMDPHAEDQWDLFSQSILLVIMEEPVVGRVKGLLLEHRRSLQASS